MIEKEFTYLIPDLYGTTKTDLNLTGTMTYKGPEYFYIAVDENNKICRKYDILILDEFTDDELINNWFDNERPILIDAKKHTLVAYLLAHDIFTDENKNDEDELFNEKHFYLEEETEPFFSHIDPIPLRDIYSDLEIYYNDETETFDIPMIDHSKIYDDEVDWFEAKKQNIQNAKDLIENGNQSVEEITALKKYITDYENIDVKYASWPQHMWPTPDFPLDQEPSESDEDHPSYVPPEELTIDDEE